MFLLSDDAVCQTIQRRAVYFWLGAALFINPILLPAGWGVGVLTGVFLCSLALFATSFVHWESDPGLWMWAASLALPMGAVLTFFEFSHWRKFFALLGANAPAQPVDWMQLRWSIDAFAALFVLGKIVRLATTVVVLNWRVTQAIRSAQATHT